MPFKGELKKRTSSGIMGKQMLLHESEGRAFFYRGVRGGRMDSVGGTAQINKQAMFLLRERSDWRQKGATMAKKRMGAGLETEQGRRRAGD